MIKVTIGSQASACSDGVTEDKFGSNLLCHSDKEQNAVWGLDRVHNSDGGTERTMGPHQLQLCDH